jgi:ArsR family transcriptional regulator, arsenate/arsenite/antimonite-responsive transcriptional repressor
MLRVRVTPGSPPSRGIRSPQPCAAFNSIVLEITNNGGWREADVEPDRLYTCRIPCTRGLALMQLSAAVGALSALAHGSRLAVFRLLVKAGENGLPAGEIARAIGILPNTLSAHLTILANVGLIVSQRDGRSIIYSADYGQMRELLGFLLDDCCDGRPEICAPLTEVVNGWSRCSTEHEAIDR